MPDHHHIILMLKMYQVCCLQARVKWYFDYTRSCVPRITDPEEVTVFILPTLRKLEFQFRCSIAISYINLMTVDLFDLRHFIHCILKVDI